MTSAEIREFTCCVPDSAIDDLRARLARTRWPEPETVDDWSQGVPLGYLREVCAYWETEYDWRRFEAKLNAHDQGLATIDGLDIHFIHAPSPEPTAQPLLITHGWPGSIVEFLDVIEPLRNPVAHGGSRDDAYHVVVPSLPGYGFSGKPTSTGWNLDRIASAWNTLMNRLGYQRFFTQGGDWGSAVATKLAQQFSDTVAGFHVNLGIANPEDLLKFGELTVEEQQQLAKFQHYADWESGYSQQQSTRPQTLGYALTDSPAGQCAWVLEKFKAWTDCDGHPEKVISRDTLLDNVSLYWFTGTAASSARLYWESFRQIMTDFAPVTAPAAYSCFPQDLFTLSERWARTRYVDLRYYSQPSRGGHFAALEQPDAFVAEVRAALRALR